MSCIHRLLKLPLVIMLLAFLYACGDDQPAGQNGNPAATGESQTTDKTGAPAPGSGASEAPETTATSEEGAAPAERTNDEPATDKTNESTMAATEQTSPPEYEVKCDANGRNCRVDSETYIGWRMYRSQCAQCHGQDAKGTTIGPNLLDRLNQRVDYPRFVDVITNGFRGQMGVMPAWKENDSVMEHTPHIYMYLKARADGALPSGRPEKLE